MNSARKHAVTALLVFLLTGCAPKNTKTGPPSQAQAPAATPVPEAGKAGAMYPPPLTESQTQSPPVTPAPAPEVAKTEPTPEPAPAPPPAAKKSTKPKPKPAATKPGGSDSGAAPGTGSDSTPVAAAGGGASTSEAGDIAAASQPSVSPIGELTPGGAAEQAQKSKETGDLINKTDEGLNAIKRPLTPQEQETASQIRAFLTKAKTALSIEDYDGAFVLATKAKVLLDELNKT